MADVVAAHQQLQEVNRATVIYSDWELAYNMQLEEALAASVISVPSHELDVGREKKRSKETSFETGHSEVNSDVLSCNFKDRASALQFQSAELVKLKEELEGQNKAFEEAHELLVEMRRRRHDREFAKSVEDMSDDEWERDGDYYEKPFVKIDDDEWDDEQVCTLYTGRLREEPGYVAMAWSLADADGHVLVEAGRYLGMEVAGYVADYTALIEGLAYAVAAGVKNLHACSNSMPVYSQVSGHWRARTPKHVQFVEQVLEQTKQLDLFEIKLLQKDDNEHVTSLAHGAIQKHIAQTFSTGQSQQVSPSGQSKGSSSGASSSGQLVSPLREKVKMEDCPICIERVRETDVFVVKGCLHRFCVSCLSQHVQIRVKSNQVPVKCPQDCSQMMDIEQCRSVLTPELVEAYTKCLIEASIPESERVYCPFPNCSALMSKGDLNPSTRPSSSRKPSPSVTGIGRTECMECHRLFCVECQVPWHADMSCKDYMNLPPDGRDLEDIKLYRLASNQNWQRCKKCRRMIELDQGCYHMTCRCGHEFCYICGAPWVNKHATCKCKLWDEQHIVGDPFLSDTESNSDTESAFDEVEFWSNYNNAVHLHPSGLPIKSYKTRMCKYWMGGYCRAGEDCTFAHGQHELRRREGLLWTSD